MVHITLHTADDNQVTNDHLKCIHQSPLPSKTILFFFQGGGVGVIMESHVRSHDYARSTGAWRQDRSHFLFPTSKCLDFRDFTTFFELRWIVSKPCR